MTTGISGQRPADLRAPRPAQADKRTTSAAFLRWHRLTLECNCSGHNPSDLARRGVGRSSLSLLGLVRHHAEGERFWFREVMAGQNPPPPFPAADPDAAFDVEGTDADVA